MTTVMPNIKLAMERSMNDWKKAIGKQRFKGNKAFSYAYLKSTNELYK